MWADDPSESDLNTVEITPSLISALAICVFVTLLFGIFPQLVARFTEVSLLASGV
jgi:type II secretory pathway component PulF